MTIKLLSTNEKAVIKWFVYAGGEKIPHNSTMRGSWGYDAACSCGWETRTGGGVHSWIKFEVENHKVYDHNYKWNNTNEDLGMKGSN